VRTIGLVDGKHMQGVDPREDLADQAGYLPGVDLDEVWDELSENQKIRAGSVERFRLELDTTIRRGPRRRA
jgi:S-adenosylmethionine:diacylglycerol 3-amino-3-carboxypropyl transferase